MSLRFLPDDRLRLPDGTTLDRGPDWLAPADARALARTADLVIYRRYPTSKDLSDDQARIEQLLEQVGSGAIYACAYSGGGISVLTLEESH